MKGHFGAGPIHLDGWLNFDIDMGHTHCEQHGDVLQTHFDDNYFDVIYGCHFFEHLAYPIDAVECLKRFHQWLKPNGILRLAVPDLMLGAEAYVNGGDLKFLYGNDFKAYYHIDCAAERLNFFVRAWEHQMTYDSELLQTLILNAGFSRVWKALPNQSSIPNFNHDRFISESLYVEAIK